MADQALVPYQKTVEISNGDIVRMYWARSGDNDDFSHEIPIIQSAWLRVWPNDDHLSVPFLVARRFGRIVIDGQQVHPT